METRPKHAILFSLRGCNLPSFMVTRGRDQVANSSSRATAVDQGQNHRALPVSQPVYKSVSSLAPVSPTIYRAELLVGNVRGRRPRIEAKRNSSDGTTAYPSQQPDAFASGRTVSVYWVHPAKVIRYRFGERRLVCSTSKVISNPQNL